VAALLQHSAMTYSRHLCIHICASSADQRATPNELLLPLNILEGPNDHYACLSIACRHWGRAALRYLCLLALCVLSREGWSNE